MSHEPPAPDVTVAAPPKDAAMRAFLSALAGVGGGAPTWSAGWSAHEVAAHVAAAAQERANLIEAHLAGEPARPTRAWEVREPPFRALLHLQLRDRLLIEISRFEAAVARMADDETITYTGWTMTAARLRTHSHSEAALHRWDLVGDDPTSRRLLAQPVLTEHALAAFAAIPALREAQRWLHCDFSDRPVRLRAPNSPDILARPGKGLEAAPGTEETDIVIETTSDERLLLLWGRCPAALRSPAANAETVDDVLARLSR